MGLANALALVRAGLALPVALLLWDAPAVAAVLFGLGVATDVLDGTAARARGEVTALGAFLDAAADKLLVLGVLVPVVVRYPSVSPVVAVLVARDLVVTWRRATLLAQDRALAVTRLARLKTALLFAGCEAYLVAGALRSFGGVAIAEALVTAGIVAALLSGIQYLAPARVSRG